MSKARWKKSLTSWSKVLVISFSLSLVGSLLSPVVAMATTASNSSIDSAPVDLTVTKSTVYVGDTNSPSIQVISKTGTSFPAIPSGDYYYAHLYNLDTGKFVSSAKITSTSSITLNFPNFIPEGKNTYQVLLSHEVYYNPAPVDNISDFTKTIGKSEAFVYERKPLALAIYTLPDSIVWDTGTTVAYKLNQEINGKDYLVQVFDMDTGQLAYSSKNKEDNRSGVKFQYGPAHSYQAFLTKGNLVNGAYDPFTNVNQLTNTMISSNTISLIRKEWHVALSTSKVTPGNISVDINVGGGQYATYLVNNATNAIIWNSEDPNKEPATNITNPRSDGIIGFTAYVARSWKERNGTTILSPTPQTYADLQDIIADSHGWYQPTAAGVSDSKQIAGGKNPAEKCTQSCHGDPVNTATGEFFDHKLDISTTGTGLIPEVERSFSTINKNNLNLLGYGWRTNYEMKISSDTSQANYDPNILTSKFLVMENENSSISSFYRKDDGSFDEAAKTMATLSYDSSTQTFKYIRNKNVTYTFNSGGNLIQIQDERNFIVTLTYSGGKLSTVSDTRGNILTFAYNANNLISTITDQTGILTTYNYNTNKQIINVINQKGIEYDYTYDSSNRLITLTNELGGMATNTYNGANQVTQQVDPLGHVMTFSYSGNLSDGSVQITYPNSKIVQETYKRGQLTQKVENFGKTSALTWKYAYDSTNQLISTVNPDLTSTTMLYDPQGNLIASIDGAGNKTSFTYDVNNSLLTSKDPLGNTTTNTYDVNNNLVSTRSPLGEITTFTYNADKSLASSVDARGNVVSANPADYTSTFAYLPNGLVSGITNSHGETNTMSYDATGDMTETVNVSGNKTKMEYNTLGLLTKIIDPLQNQTATSYDKMGNVLTSTNAKGAVTTYTYDLVGNRLTAKNALNQTTTYIYSSTNKPVTITQADGTVQTITYDVFDRPTDLKDQILRVTKQEWDSNSRMTASIDTDGGRTEYTYDAAGNLKTMKTPLGAVTSYSYDKMNRPIKITDALGRSTLTEYDANGKVAKTTAADGTTTENFYDVVGNIIQTKNETGVVKTYTYDSLNRKVSATNELGQVTSYTYDAASNLISQTRPDSSVVGYTYDARNLLLSIDYPGTTEDITYAYDELGRKITEQKGTDATITYTYDSLNRVTSRGTATSTVSYSYDSVGNLLTLTYPSGRVVTYGYDAAAQLTQLNSAGVGATIFSYNNRSLQTTTSLANGVTESKAYDADSQLTSTELLNGSTSLYKRAQSYNLGGEVTQRGSATNGAALTLENFTYDPVSRLTQHTADGSGQSLNNYGYNAVGNLVAVGNTNQTYDTAGKVTTTGSAGVSYDARNNRTALADTTDASKNVEYTWAQNNLLTSATTHTDTASKTVSYTYGADSLLQSRTEGTSVDAFVWDSSRKIPAMLSDGKYEYIYSKDRTPIAQVEVITGTVTYLHHDLTGSVTASTNANGGLIGTVDYSPYGVPTRSVLSRFGYAGEWADASTGYSYLKARWLDTKAGTFLSEDPLVQMTNNAFGYTEGNPITQIDPLGLSVWDDLRQSDGYKMFDKVNWTNVANTVGAIAIGVTVAALIIGTGGIAAPVIGALVFSASVASAVTATGAAGQTCINDKSFETQLSNDCSWGIAGAALSWLPLAAKGSKLTKLAETKVPDRIPNDPGAAEALNAKVALAKFGQGAMDFSAGAASGLSSLISGHWRTDNKCINMISDM